MEQVTSTYLDYKTFLCSSFSSFKFANEIVLATNNLHDSPLDLTTPLSRVLFDVQEVDTSVDQIANHLALPILEYTKENVHVSQKVLEGLETQISILNISYSTLYREILARHDAAAGAGAAAIHLWQTLRLGRLISSYMTLSRQLEILMTEVKGDSFPGGSQGNAWAMVRSAYTILSIRQISESKPNSVDFIDLNRIFLIQSLKERLANFSEKSLISYAERVIGHFSVSSLGELESDKISMPAPGKLSDDTEIEAIKSRTVCALTTLYLLSPIDQTTSQDGFNPSLLLSTLQEYVRRAITSSLTGLTSALTMPTKLDRTLTEISARCQNIVALELLLQTAEPPKHPLLKCHGSSIEGSARASTERHGLLQPLLSSLDTTSLVSYFWRSMASQMAARMQKLLRDGGVSMRVLRNNRDRLRDALKYCVKKGSQLPISSLSKTMETRAESWDREAAVMAGSVVNPLGRL